MAQASNGSSPGTIPYGSSVIHSGRVDMTAPMPTSNLRGKTIVITGGASGFGKACFEEWASHGAHVIIGDINARTGEELVASVRQATGSDKHHFIPLDVTSWPSQVAFFKQAVQLSSHGGIDAVMANAGVADAPEQLFFEQPTLDYAAEENPRPPRMRTYDINMTGVLYTSHLALSYLSRNPGSENCSPEKSAGARDRHLLLVSSIAGLCGLPGQPLYAVAKHGVVGLFRTLRITSPVKTGVRVNMINPYFVDTPILGPLGALVLAGGAMAPLSAVVRASTRLVADQGIVGRALMIGPPVTPEQARLVGLEDEFRANANAQKVDGQDVWDCYAHDFVQTDLFTRRIVGVTNLITAARGWRGLLGDVGGKMRKALGW